MDGMLFMGDVSATILYDDSFGKLFIYPFFMLIRTVNKLAKTFDVVPMDGMLPMGDVTILYDDSFGGYFL